MEQTGNPVKKYNFVGNDDFFGPYFFTVSDVEIMINFDDTGHDAISGTITTEKGSAALFEWITDGEIERTDSNLRINGFEELETIFAPENARQPVPLGAIHDALDEIVEDLCGEEE